MARNNNVIDLTLDDDDASPAAAIPVSSISTLARVKAHFPLFPNDKHSIHNLTNHHSSSNGGSGNGNGHGHRNNGSPGNNSNKNHDIDGRDDRPSKRRRVDASSSTPGSAAAAAAAVAVTPTDRTTTTSSRAVSGSGSAPPTIDRKALMRCLNQQVIPHMDAALNQLPRGFYDIRRLGKEIISRIADRDLEYHFRCGGGKLADDVETHIVGRIQRLLEELIKDPVSFPPFAPSIRLPSPSTFLFSLSREYLVSI